MLLTGGIDKKAVVYGREWSLHGLGRSMSLLECILAECPQLGGQLIIFSPLGIRLLFVGGYVSSKPVRLRNVVFAMFRLGLDFGHCSHVGLRHGPFEGGEPNERP
jgi:hypothetical protein